MSLLRRIGDDTSFSGRRMVDVEVELLYTVQSHIEHTLREKGVWLDPEDDKYLFVIVRTEVGAFIQEQDIQISIATQYELVRMIVENLIG